MKVGLIGYGYWGKILAKYLEKDVFFDLESIYTSQKDVTLGTNSLVEIVNSDIEAVIIASPHETHYVLCKQFLNAGKHVFCEKPFVEPALADELYMLAEKKEVKLYVNYIYTCSPSIKKMKELLPSIGNIVQAQFEISQYGKFYPGANSMETLGCHMLSVFYYLVGAGNTLNWIIEPKENGLIQKLTTVNKDASISVYSSLVQEEKTCSISIEGKLGELFYTPLIENTLVLNTLEGTQSYSFDEKNNISLCLLDFKAVIEGVRENKKNMVLAVSSVLKEVKNAKS